MSHDHHHCCHNFYDRFKMVCVETSSTYLTSPLWRYIRRQELPCATCCAWLEKHKSNLSGRIYLLQVEEYEKSADYRENKTADVIDIM
jgi:hypothetical protein